MIHVETQPLSHTLHPVDEVAARWFRVLNDPRWIGARKPGNIMPRLQPSIEPLHHPVTLRLKGGGAHLLVVLDEAQWPSVRLLQQISDPSRQEAVVNLWAHEALRQLRDVGCHVERCHLDADAQLPSAACVSMQLGECVVDLYPETASDRFVEGMQKFLTGLALPVTQRLLQWPLASSVTLAERSFSLSRLEALKRDDLVFWGASDVVMLRVYGTDSGAASGMVAACQLNTKDLTMEDTLHEEAKAVAFEEPLQTLAKEDNTETRPASYAGLQVNVRFEIDGPAMTVAQAIGFKPGEVIALPTPVDQARVRLRCQGRCFAHGELVNVGGQLGVRIIDVGGQDV